MIRFLTLDDISEATRIAQLKPVRAENWINRLNDGVKNMIRL